jgi:hypothetical protein
MGYTDQEMETFRSDPEKVKMVTQTPEFVKCKVIAEVIESHGCHAGHLLRRAPKGCACLPWDQSATPCQLSTRG